MNGYLERPTPGRIVEEPIDFAVITALPVERKAVVGRLTAPEKVQEPGEPLTFYRGHVPIPGESTPYTVVVIQLLDMGNLDAAAATARVLQRYRPRNVLMVGIAGGVRGEVTLGDVVVARQACYYEPAKLRAKRDEPRERQFHADAMLLGRAQHYEESDWTAQIDVPRPGESAPPDSHPRAHVGTIACGEKVVADPAELVRIGKICPKMLAVAMEGAGVGRAVLTTDRPPRYLEIRGISDYAGPEKTDGWHEYAANAAAAFAFGFLRSKPIPPGPPPEDRPGAAADAPTLIISAQSLRPIELREFLPALDPSFQRGEVDFLPLDFTDLAANKAITDPEAAARRVAGPQGVLLTALARRGDARLVFHGLAAIPLLVLAGHVASDRRPVALYDYHPVPGTWAWPGTGEEFPPMAVAGVPKRRVNDACEVVVRVGVSYPILPAQTLAAVPAPRVQIDLSVPDERGVVRSEAQTRSYGATFRGVLDAVSQQVPTCRRVHLFYAGPVSLGFHLGQQISENIHPPVVAWNFSRGYDWAIDLGKAIAGEPCVVRPPAAATEGT